MRNKKGKLMGMCISSYELRANHSNRSATKSISFRE